LYFLAAALTLFFSDNSWASLDNLYSFNSS
jgi:hypothetical protein